MLLSYRGYGISGGTPSEKGLQLDAEAAMEHIMSRTDIDKSKVFVFGRSLGGAVAVHLAQHYKDNVREV
jgi:pimeloyl-ACP methyl ester carboxylesterase